MRAAFISALCAAASGGLPPWLLIGDVGYGVVEPFAESVPDHCINIGVAEQAMIGMAAGMASRGEVAVTYSIANFGSLRCLEQIRNDVCHEDRSVVITTVGAGKSYRDAGYSHFGLEDIAAIRALPNIEILSPRDDEDAFAATAYALRRRRPTYLRLARGSVARQTCVELLPVGDEPLAPIVSQPSAGVMIVANGTAAAAAMEVFLCLRGRLNDVGICVLARIPTSPAEAAAAVSGASTVIVIEDHASIGGIGSLLAESIARRAAGVRLVHIALSPTETSAHDGDSVALGDLEPAEMVTFIEDRLGR